MNSTLLRKTLELSMTSHCSRQQIKFNFTSMKPAGIVIILVTAYQLSIAAVVNRNLIVTWGIARRKTNFSHPSIMF